MTDMICKKTKHPCLGELQCGAHARILSLRGNLVERQKLHGLGFRKGLTLKVLRKDKGCPCLLQVGDVQIAISDALFDNIIVRVA
jgi:Fe2+ transport system protein FeoA